METGEDSGVRKTGGITLLSHSIYSCCRKLARGPGAVTLGKSWWIALRLSFRDPESLVVMS